jgi:hypothetical protein
VFHEKATQFLDGSYDALGAPLSYVAFGQRILRTSQPVAETYVINYAHRPPSVVAVRNLLGFINADIRAGSSTVVNPED